MTQSWDKYFFDITNVIASNSKCLSRKIGAIIVRDKSIISTGYNGAASGLPHCETRFQTDPYLQARSREKDISLYDHQTCPRKFLGYKSGEGVSLCIASHAERNTLINAAKNGIAINGCSMYMNCPIPCTPCLLEIINGGIKEIVVTSKEYYDGESEWILNNSSLLVRCYEN